MHYIRFNKHEQSHERDHEQSQCDFDFVCLICLKSALINQKPDQIVIHINS